MRDIDVRQALHEQMLVRFKEDGVSRVLDELVVGYDEARVDVAVINGALHGYEIKSDSDTLERLPHQVRAYCQALDYVTLVASPRHLERAEGMVPAWWGLVSAQSNSRGRVKLKTVRRRKRNPSITPLGLAVFLWRVEALAFLEQRGARGIRGWTKAQLWDLMAATASADDISSYVRRCLKTRPAWRADEPQSSHAGSPPRRPMSASFQVDQFLLHSHG
jgi:hypothetical protein